MPYKVRVSTRPVSWPPFCACCLGPADGIDPIPCEAAGIPQQGAADSQIWEVPYCQDCLAHVRQRPVLGSGSRWINVAVVIVFLGLVLSSWLYGNWILFGLLTVTLALAAAAAQSLLHYQHELAQDRAAAMCHPDCATPGPAVTYHGCDDSADVFECASQRYAEALAQSNRKKSRRMKRLLT